MDQKQKAIEIIKAYGGFDNIVNVDYCLTKLRIQIKNPSTVNEMQLKKIGALGVIESSPNMVFAVFGVESESIGEEIKKIIKNISKNPSLKKEYTGDK